MDKQAKKLTNQRNESDEELNPSDVSDSDIDTKGVSKILDSLFFCMFAFEIM